MTEPARDLLTAFDTLAPVDQQQVAAEILRRTAATGDLPEATLHELADELFRAYDAERQPTLLTEAQRQELERRVAEDDAAPKDVIPWEQVKTQALARL